MRELLLSRLNELKKEWETGQDELQQLLLRQKHLQETMLRISGAVQVIEEFLNNGAQQQK